MKPTIGSLIGFTMHAMDGEIGKVEDLYFDDLSWTIRYLVVRTGGWLLGRKVLISPQALAMPDWKNRAFPTDLSKDQIRNSPDIDTDMPVSRQQEELLHKHYPWQDYWGGGFAGNGFSAFLPFMPILESVSGGEGAGDQPQVNLHLRSAQQITGYSALALDGEIGAVKDLSIDDTDWKIKFLLIKTAAWAEGKHLLLPTQWIKEIRWACSEIIIGISAESVKHHPFFDETESVSKEYEPILFDHFGHPLEDRTRTFNLN